MTFNCHIDPECSEFTQAHGDFPPSSQKPNCCKRSYPIIQTKALVPGYPPQTLSSPEAKVKGFMIRQISYPPPWLFVVNIYIQLVYHLWPFFGASGASKTWPLPRFFPVGLGGTFSTLSPQCTDSVEEASTIPEGNSTWKKREGLFFFQERIGKHKDLSKISRRQSLLKTYHASN